MHALDLSIALLRGLLALFRSRQEQAVVELALRQQLDHVVVLGEDHLKRLLRVYVEYYNTDRIHTSLRDAPAGRATDARASERARVIGLPCVGGLHHRYVWCDAA
jgi:hypothetical protein